MTHSPGTTTPASAPQRLSAAGRHKTFLVFEVALAWLVVYLYTLEGPGFLKLFTLASAGFVVNIFLAARYRIWFFVGLSVCGLFLLLGPKDGVWLLAVGLSLIGIAHLPWPFPARVLAQLALGAVLAAARGGLLSVPWTAAVWPVVGSMFMFRLVLYMLAARTSSHRARLPEALAYFFMLPNVAFPLFPVVDYQTFRRTYYDRDELVTYQQGVHWVSRGLLQLVLYRVVYYSLLGDPVDVQSLSQLVLFMLATFALYLKVSGQFHLIVGMLNLFGFRLPETNHLYFLSRSFTELWRRINIYWKDFMMKVVFYPTFFKVRHLGPGRALALATATVFVSTWLLHSYQWFWLRGGFPMTLPDILFWGLLGALVVAGALHEAAPNRTRPARPRGWNPALGLRAAATFCGFCFLWSLWYAESVGQWVWMLGAAANVDWRGLGLLGVTIVVLVALGGRDWDTVGPAPSSLLRRIARQPVARTVAALAVLLAVSWPGLVNRVPPAMAPAVLALHASGLNARDAALRHRGYYEQLDVGGQNQQLLGALRVRDDQWEDLSKTGVLRERRDLLLRDLSPSRSVVWNGNQFSTNRWGMRDRDYDLMKPPGTLRIAVLGPSHVMGNGVPDGATFEALVEERLNREQVGGRYRRVEILNFAVDGYTLAQQVAMLEDRVVAFSPDIVIATHYVRGRIMAERYLVKLVTADVPVPPGRLARLMSDAGLLPVDRGRLPVPFPAGRRAAKWLGLSPRMPAGELAARVRRISEDVVCLSFERFAEVSAANGITPIVLALNAVVDDAPPQIPNRALVEGLGLPLFDLFDVFPKEQRPALRVAAWDDHPNVLGHRLIAERLYEELVRFLGTGGSRTVEAAIQTSRNRGGTDR